MKIFVVSLVDNSSDEEYIDNSCEEIDDILDNWVDNNYVELDVGKNNRDHIICTTLFY